MATNPTITEQIRQIALEILSEKPEGIRYSDLVKKILEQNNSFKSNSIAGVIVNLEVAFPDKVYKPDRGVFRLLRFKEDIATQPDKIDTSIKITKKKNINEDDFYQPFADWLVKELEECTNALTN